MHLSTKYIICLTNMKAAQKRGDRRRYSYWARKVIKLQNR